MTMGVQERLSGRIIAEEARIREAYARRHEQLRDQEASWSNPDHVYGRQDMERHVLAWLHRLAVPLARTRILEVGCGTGAWLRDFIRWGVPPENIWGVDLLPDVVDEARRRCPAGVHLDCHGATHLPFHDGTFDLVLQALLFTSLLDAEVRRVVAGEMLRVVRRDGLILWYDFHVHNPWNRDVRRVGRPEIAALFPGCRIELQRVTLAPPVSRWISPRSYLLWCLLGKVPWLCTHYLGVIRTSSAPHVA